MHIEGSKNLIEHIKFMSCTITFHAQRRVKSFDRAYQIYVISKSHVQKPIDFTTFLKQWRSSPLCRIRFNWIHGKSWIQVMLINRFSLHCITRATHALLLANTGNQKKKLGSSQYTFMKAHESLTWCINKTFNTSGNSTWRWHFTLLLFRLKKSPINFFKIKLLLQVLKSRRILIQRNQL